MIGSRFTGSLRGARLLSLSYGLLATAVLVVAASRPVRASDSPAPVVIPNATLQSATQVASAKDLLLTQPLTVESALDANSLNFKVAHEGGRQVTPALRSITFALRAGAVISPRVKFIGGGDITFNSLGLPDGLKARIDAEAIVDYNLGGGNTVIPVTFDLVYAKSLFGLTNAYLGAGVGPYINTTTRFGGKIFIGATVTKNIGAELGVHFTGYGDPLLTLEARVPFL